MTTQIIEYNVTQAAIAELAKEKETLLAAPELNYKAIDDARKRNGKIRIAIEKRRKEYKADALEYGRSVDSKAKEASEPVAAIEDAYKDVLNKREAELEAVRVAEEEKENERIAAIKDKIDYYTGIGIGQGFSSNELKSELEHVQSYLTEGFDFQEFSDEMKSAFEEKEAYINQQLEERLKFEVKQAEQAAQRKKDEEARLELQAEKAAFEQQQKDAQVKIDAELAAIQKEKDELKQADVEREEKKQQAIHKEKMREAKEQLAKQCAIDEDARKKADEIEKLRLEQVAKEEAERKALQAGDDRVRDAAPKMLEALDGMILYSTMCESWQDDEGKIYLIKAQAAIKLAKGE